MHFVSIFFTLALVSGVSFGQPPTDKRTLTNPEAFRRVKARSDTPTNCEQSFAACARRILELNGDFGSGDAEGRIQDETFHFSSGVSIYLRTMRGLHDDSIDAVRYRLAFKRVTAGYAFVQAGSQQPCQPRRGPRGWTKGKCL